MDAFAQDDCTTTLHEVQEPRSLVTAPIVMVVIGVVTEVFGALRGMRHLDCLGE